MAEVRWIKLATDVFDNRKIRQIEKMPDGDALIIIWFKLLVLAGTVNDGGMIYLTRDIPYTEQLLANEFNRPISTIQLALQTFSRFGMIEIANDLIHVTNWEKYQNANGLDRIREQTRNRVAAFRERQKELPACNATSNASVTQSNATEKNRVDKNRVDKKESKRFAPPTVEEVAAYCKERRNGIDPQHFVDYYTARGWELKPGQKVKDWKACVRTWEQRNPKPKEKPSPVTKDDIDRLEKYLGRFKKEET